MHFLTKDNIIKPMKMALSFDQKVFFNENGYLQLEGVLDPEKVEIVKNLAPAGSRDLFRASEQMRKSVLPRNLVDLVLELGVSRPLRFGLDQLISSGMFSKGGSLEKLFCLQGIEVGIFYPLEEGPEESFFPTRPGDVLLVKGERHLPVHTIESKMMLAVLVRSTSVYIRNLRDPHAHALKELGYAYGDKLKDQFHPVVCR